MILLYKLDYTMYYYAIYFRPNERLEICYSSNLHSNSKVITIDDAFPILMEESNVACNRTPILEIFHACWTIITFITANTSFHLALHGIIHREVSQI